MYDISTYGLDLLITLLDDFLNLDFAKLNRDQKSRIMKQARDQKVWKLAM